MYYRKANYPRAGQADVPDDLWEEFQRIRGHLSSLDQNNFASRTIKRQSIIRPDDKHHYGASDIVNDRGDKFLYDERVESLSDPIITLTKSGGSRWRDLSEKGIKLHALSRGDCPWVVGVSVNAVVGNEDELVAQEVKTKTDEEWSQVEKMTGLPVPKISVNSQLARSLADFWGLDGLSGSGVYNPVDHPFAQDWAPSNPYYQPDISYSPDGPLEITNERAQLLLRVKCSQEGLSAAEAVGTFGEPAATGCAIATVAMFMSRGGPVQFSPAIRVRAQRHRKDWTIRIVRANIWAFGLYR